MSEEEKIKELYRKYWEFMRAKDIDGLREIMADDYYLMHMTGVRQSREEFLAGLRGGTFNYYSAQHDEIDVQVSGETAKMTGKSKVLAAVYGGGRNRWRLQGDFTLRLVEGRWLLTSSQASTY